MTALKAKRDGTCGRCRGPIAAGDDIEGQQGVGWCHDVCPGPPPPFARQADLDIVVAHLNDQKAAGRLNTFTSSLLSQYEVKGRLSDGQLDAVLRKLDDPRPAGGENGNRYASLPDRDQVPAARYCLDRPDGAGLYFVRIWRPPAGHEKIPNYIQGYLLYGRREQRLNPKQLKQALDALVQVGPGEAAIRYGMEVCHCSKCDAALKKYLSRELGIGPTCGKAYYSPDEWTRRKAAARVSLRARGIDPEDTVGDELDPADEVIARLLQTQLSLEEV